jgi:hypothetical protein
VSSGNTSSKSFNRSFQSFVCRDYSTEIRFVKLFKSSFLRKSILYYTLILKPRQIAAKRKAVARVLQFGRKFQQRNKGKGPLIKPGMGDFEQRGIVDDTAAKEQYINIQAALPPAPFFAPVPAVFLFNSLNQGKKFFWRTGIESCCGAVEKAALVQDIQGRRLIERSDPEAVKKRGKLPQSRFQYGPAVAGI